MLRNFTIIRVSVNRLYVNVTLRKLRWRQLAPAVDERKTKTKQNNGLLQRKKQAIELTHEWIVNFDLNSLLHLITIKMNKGDTPIQNDETQFNCT